MADDAAEGLHDPDTFFIPTLPWFVTRPTNEGYLQADRVIRLALTDDGVPAGSMTPLFTDEDLAVRFITAPGSDGTGFEPYRIAVKSWVVAALTDLKKLGVTHVCFDPGPRDSLPRVAPRLIDIVTAAFRDQPG